MRSFEFGLDSPGRFGCFGHRPVGGTTFPPVAACTGSPVFTPARSRSLGYLRTGFGASRLNLVDYFGDLSAQRGARRLVGTTHLLTDQTLAGLSVLACLHPAFPKGLGEPHDLCTDTLAKGENVAAVLGDLVRKKTDLPSYLCQLCLDFVAQALELKPETSHRLENQLETCPELIEQHSLHVDALAGHSLRLRNAFEPQAHSFEVPPFDHSGIRTLGATAINLAARP